MLTGFTHPWGWGELRGGFHPPCARLARPKQACRRKEESGERRALLAGRKNPWQLFPRAWKPTTAARERDTVLTAQMAAPARPRCEPRAAGASLRGSLVRLQPPGAAFPPAFNCPRCWQLAGRLLGTLVISADPGASRGAPVRHSWHCRGAAVPKALLKSTGWDFRVIWFERLSRSSTPNAGLGSCRGLGCAPLLPLLPPLLLRDPLDVGARHLGREHGAAGEPGRTTPRCLWCWWCHRALLLGWTSPSAGSLLLRPPPLPHGAGCPGGGPALRGYGRGSCLTD